MDMLRKCPYRQIFITGDRHEGFRYNYQCGGRHIRRRPWHAFGREGLKERFQQILMQALGVCTIFIGISGALKGMLRVENGTLETTGTMLLIASLVTGSLLGEWIQIEKWMDRFGEWLREKVGGKNDSQFVEGFVSASLVICVGAMPLWALWRMVCGATTPCLPPRRFWMR